MAHGLMQAKGKDIDCVEGDGAGDHSREGDEGKHLYELKQCEGHCNGKAVGDAVIADALWATVKGRGR